MSGPTPTAPDSPVEATQPTTPAKVVPPEFIDLPSGMELDDLAAAKLQAARLTRLVVVAGPVGAGKTTLLTTLYDLFQMGKVSDYSFAGSKTLPAFERRCHLSRTASERAIPDTERTKVGEVRYLHLQVASDDLHNPLDLLFTDVSGESFERARDSISECKELTFLRLAEHFLLLIDCEKIVDPLKRHQVMYDGVALLRSCLDSGMLDNTCFVNLLWTKYDFVEATGDGGHTDFLERTAVEFRTLFGSRVGKLEFTKVAARPTKTDRLKFGSGVPELLKQWVRESPRDRSMNVLPDPAVGLRESEKFLGRHFRAVQEEQ